MSLPDDLQCRLVTLEEELRVEGWDPTPAEMIDWLARELRPANELPARLELAARLWAFGTQDARILAAKLLTQARMRPDDAIWAALTGWIAELGAGAEEWALIESVSRALDRRIEAAPERLAEITPWVSHENAALRAAFALVARPNLRLKMPKAADLARRDELLVLLAPLAADRDQMVQRALASALRDLAKHDAPRATTFLLAHGNAMVPWARRESIGRLPIALDDRGRITGAPDNH
ncbi:DNA alkylation repair protein [Ketogulonicigenium vulgare]|uniref:DNA alkylation repair enzyme superfamily protein n=1 Tax=Ketogulonicigenium vulgare (strain WSH-001) TaxID=759362 RepID=F9Y3X7_KETVW|nr:DNA alkylation repair protein [Ketogulonicigenium vulgare]ADO43383.1 DNA alkylation repair enzyme superfamily protein [Ketogulonicigenium vulgare Y25]AEM41668.1 DNA alkylation repair enzyme superfamily protein [Ketogulonicigenium vulgare WSH-001]ALJ81779.1 DNA alkylation repair protein [Ketogulonicigenium vulgare]ANW34435.1 DNA alkylation repair protein [Ketogulonicigenium vulgare]AOZ55418.1 DNA alkylation repair enzyme superfamily protein [Ketogulonicigenium vulgare]